MAKVKEITDDKQANDALARIIALKAELDLVIKKADAKVTKATAELIDSGQLTAAELVAVEKAVEDYSRRRLPLRRKMSDRLTLPLGDLKGKKRPRLEVPDDKDTQAQIIAKLEAMGHGHCVKNRPRILKSAVIQLPEDVLDELASLGVKVVNRRKYTVKFNSAGEHVGSVA